MNAEETHDPTQDVNTHIADATSPAGRISDLAKANPALKSDPVTLMALSRVSNAPAQTVGLASHALHLIGALQPSSGMPSSTAHKESFADGNRAPITTENGLPLKAPTSSFANQLKDLLPEQTPPVGPKTTVQNGVVVLPERHPSAPGGFFHAFAHDFDYLRHAGASGWDGAVPAMTGTVNSLMDAAKRTLTTVEEILPGATSGSYYNNLTDAVNTVKNVVGTPINAINPFSSQNLLLSLEHIGAAFITNAKLHGDAWAMGNLIPQIINVMVLRDVAGLGTAGEVPAAIDEATVEELQARGATGKILNEIDQNRLRAAFTRMGQRNAASQTEAEAEAATERLQSTITRLRGNVSNAVDGTIKNLGLTTPIRAAFKALDLLGAPGRAVETNLMAAIANQTSKDDPYSNLIWQLTAGGQVYGADGQPESFGKGFAEFLGGHQGDMWFAPVESSANFYGQWIGADPFGAVGKITAQARTAEGLGGLLGKWFNGIGVDSAQEFEDVLSKYTKARRAVRWMATHDASQIMERFQGTFTFEQAEILGRAKTYNEVADIMGQFADAHGIARSLAPTLTVGNLIGSKFKYGFSALRDLLNRSKAAENIPDETVKSTELAEINRAINSLGKEGIEVADKTVSEKLDPWVDNVIESKRLRALKNFFNKRPLWTDPQTLKQESVEVQTRRPAAAIKGIREQMQAIGIKPAFISQISNELYRYVGYPRAFRKLFLEAWGVMPRSILKSGLDNHALATFRPSIDDFLDNELSRLYSHDQGSTTATQIAGRNHEDLSPVFRSSGIDVRPAVGDSEIGNLFIPRIAELRSMGTQMREMIKRNIPANLIDINTMLQMSLKDLETLADFTKANLNGLKDIIPEINIPTQREIDLGILDSSANYKVFVDGYESARETVLDIVKGFTKKDVTPSSTELESGVAKTDAERTAGAFNKIRETYLQSRELLQVAQEYNLYKNIGPVLPETEYALLQRLQAIPGGTGLTIDSLTPEIQIRAKGVMNALEDGAREIGMRMRTSVFGEKELEEQAREFIRNQSPNGIVSEKLAKTWQEETRRLQMRNPSYLPYFHRVVDGMGVFMNQTWSRLALFSGNWDFHIFGSEGALNLARFNVKAWLDSRIIESYIRHSVGYMKLSEDENKGLLESVLERVNAARMMQNNRDLFTVFDRENFKFLNIFRKDSAEALQLNAMGRAVGGAIAGVDNIIKATRDIAGGTILGFEKSSIRALSKEENFANLVDSTVWMYMNTNGHLVDAIEGIGGGLIEHDTVDQATKKLVLGFGKDGKSKASRLYKTDQWALHGMSSHADNFGSALHQGILRVARDKIKSPVLQDFAQLMYDMGSALLAESNNKARGAEFEAIGGAASITGATAGALEGAPGQLAPKFGVSSYTFDGLPKPKTAPNFLKGLSRKQIAAEASRYFTHDQIVDALLPKAMEILKNLPNGERENFVRQELRLHPDVQNKRPGMDNALGDHALALVNDVIGHFMGSKLSDVVHTDWLMDTADGKFVPVEKIMNDLLNMPSIDRPVNIPGRVMVPFRSMDGAIQTFGGLGLIGKVMDKGFEKVLGRPVTRLVREPAMAIQNHIAYENYRDLVERGIWPEHDARAKALYEAFLQNRRFIHNPMDKTMFEHNVKAVMPFYFAQNQMWRRVMRLASDNPGAAYRYTKAMLGLSQTVYIDRKQTGGNLTAWVPGSEYIVDPLLAIIGLPGRVLTNAENIGITNVIGSIATMDPFGNNPSPGSVAGSIARPSVGPLVELPLEGIAGLFGLLHEKWGQDFIKAIDPNVQYGWYSSIQPSAALGAIAAAAGAQIGGTEHNSLTASFVNTALKNVIEQETEKNVAIIEKEYASQIASNPSYYDAGWISAMATARMTKEWSQASYAQEQITNARAIGLSMAVAQSLADVLWFGKGKISDLLSQSADYAKFNSEYSSYVMPDGKQQYSSLEILNMFLQKNPAFLVYQTPKTSDYGMYYPDTKAFVDLATQYPETLKQYPNGSALMFGNGGKFDLAAVTMQTEMGLRGENTPPQVINSWLIHAGQLYVNDVINPQFPNYNPNNSNSLTPREREERKNLINSYLTTNLPYAQYRTYTTNNFYQAQAINEMKKMLMPESNLPDTFFGGSEARRTWQTIINGYFEVSNKISEETLPKRIKQDAVYRWADECTAIANSGAYDGLRLNSAQISFFSSVAKYLPTVTL
jgi:hypothetical protein